MSNHEGQHNMPICLAIKAEAVLGCFTEHTNSSIQLQSPWHIGCKSAIALKSIQAIGSMRALAFL